MGHLLSLLASLWPLGWLVQLDEAMEAAWDLDDPLLRGDAGRQEPWIG